MSREIEKLNEELYEAVSQLFDVDDIPPAVVKEIYGSIVNGQLDLNNIAESVYSTALEQGWASVIEIEPQQLTKYYKPLNATETAIFVSKLYKLSYEYSLKSLKLEKQNTTLLKRHANIIKYQADLVSKMYASSINLNVDAIKRDIQSKQNRIDMLESQLKHKLFKLNSTEIEVLHDEIDELNEVVKASVAKAKQLNNAIKKVGDLLEQTNSKEASKAKSVSQPK